MVSTGIAAQELVASLRLRLTTDLQAIAARHGGVLGVQLVDLTDGTVVGLNADMVFPQASAIKVPLLLELYRQAERKPALLKIRKSIGTDTRTGGSGVLSLFVDGSSMISVEDLATLMVVLSDNTATNILIDEVGADNVNALLDGLGLSQTRWRRKMMRFDASARGEENVSTPAEAAAFMRRLAACDLPVSRETCARVRSVLEMPKDDPFRDPIPQDIKVAFKPGYTDAVRTAWGLVDLPGRPYVVAVMSTFNIDVGATDGADAVREVSRAAFDHFRRVARANVYGVRTPKP